MGRRDFTQKVGCGAFPDGREAAEGDVILRVKNVEAPLSLERKRPGSLRRKFPRGNAWDVVATAESKRRIRHTVRQRCIQDDVVSCPVPNSETFDHN